HQLTSIPKPFSGTYSSSSRVNQPDEVKTIRSRRELAADGLQGEKESAVEHGLENAVEAPRTYKGFSANCRPSLNSVSQPKGAFQFLFPCTINVEASFTLSSP